MRVRLLTLRFDSALDCFDDRPLDALLAGRELLSLREHFFTSGGVPHLLCVVEYREAITKPSVASGGSNSSSGASRSDPIPAATKAAVGKARKVRASAPDPLEQLDERQRLLFQTMRAWRSDTAGHEGVPPYVVLTNRELVAVVQRLPRSRSALVDVPGIGKGKVERYGESLLAKLADALADEPTRVEEGAVVQPSGNTAFNSTEEIAE
ncbi:MAG: hypothetical protein ACI835_005707 [Planctomycetota bacterium]|jgi:hypothetical protein